MSDIQAPNGFETNETLDGAADVMEVFQPGSGGVRRNKKALLDTLTAFFKNVLERIIVSTDITMTSPENYLVSGNYDLTLPSSPAEGDVIDILADGYPKIIQDDAEHVINYKDRHFTTKGTSGYIQLFSKNNIELVYKGTGLSRLATPAKVSALDAPEGDGQGCAFSYDGIYLAVAHSNSPYITVYKRTGDAFAKVSALTAPEGGVLDCAFSYDGTYLAVAHVTSQYITVYKRTGDAFAKVSALTAPEGDGLDCAFSYDGTYLAVAHATSPFITVYKTKESASKVWIASKFETMNPADPSDGDAGDLIYRFV